MRRLAALTILFSMMFQLPACAWTHNVDGEIHQVVGLVGDSNIVNGADRISQAFTPSDIGDIPVIVAATSAAVRWNGCLPPIAGRPCINENASNYWATRLAALPFTPDVWVVDLGINDALSPGTATSPGYSGYPTKIDYIMSRLVGPVVWTPLPCAIEPSAYWAGCQQVNTAIYGARSRWPNLTVPTWNTVANSHPEYMSAPGNVHYSDQGYDAWASTVLAALG